MRAPYKPIGGEIYVFEAQMAGHHVGDGYRWRSSTGFQPLQTRQNILVYRKAKKIITPTSRPKGDPRFMIYLYRLAEVHYVGDSSVYQPMPHKSMLKTSEREFIRTAPTIRAKATSNLDHHPQQIYEEILCEPKPFQPAYQPRDRKQIENFQYAERTRNRLSQDSLNNLYVLGFEYSDFIKEYLVNFESENNVVYVSHPGLLDKLNELLRRPPDVYTKCVEIFYDTTFQLGQFYVSVFCFRHYMLKGRPTIPAAFLIHQRKFSSDHEAFLLSLAKSCPNLMKTRFAFITDREFKDIASVFPKAQHLYCWTHIRRDVRHWSEQRIHRGPDYQRMGDDGTYSDDIKQLLKQQLEKFWTQKFKDYFDKHLKTDLITKACRWVVESTGLYNSWSGITTNPVEAINSVLSRSFTKPSKIDEAVLTLYHLTGEV